MRLLALEIQILIYYKRIIAELFSDDPDYVAIDFWHWKVTRRIRHLKEKRRKK